MNIIFSCYKIDRRLRVGMLVVGAVLFFSILAWGVGGGTQSAAVYPELRVENGGGGEFEPMKPKTIYLTFDDGPSQNTAKILDTLLEYNIRATFFVTGKTDEYSKGLMKRIVEEGHTIAVHTYSHKYKEIYRSVESYLSDFKKMDDLIFELTGQHSKIFRFPGGSLNKMAPSQAVRRQIVAEMTARGYVYYDWNVVSGDDTPTVYPKEKLAENILEGCKGKQSAVVLCHDNASRTTTPDAVAIAIERLLQEGYSFARITETVSPIQFAKQYQK